jgi:hypothetical protein
MHEMSTIRQHAIQADAFKQQTKTGALGQVAQRHSQLARLSNYTNNMCGRQMHHLTLITHSFWLGTLVLVLPLVPLEAAPYSAHVTINWPCRPRQLRLGAAATRRLLEGPYADAYA